MDLAHALRLSTTEPPCLALVGAGGKTTALFSLARQLLSQGWAAVLVTATTHLAAEQTHLADQHIVLEDRQRLEAALPASPRGLLLFTGAAGADERVAGLAADGLEALRVWSQTRRLPLLIEADGSRRLPLKAPAEHEPALPAWVQQVVVVAGVGALGEPLGPDWVHRPERFAALTGLESGAAITVEALAAALLHPQGGLKRIPEGARRVALLNGADGEEQQAQAARLARLLLPGYEAALVASLGLPAGVYAAWEPVAGIVLAGGGSSRLGRPKQLLDWRGEPFVRRVARNALQAGLDPVVLVTGADAPAVAAAVQGLPVQVAHNPQWQAGQSTSLAAGLSALPPSTGAAIFLLADQPHAPPTLLESLMALHASTLAPIVAPQAGGRRANPVLFDRRTFPELLAQSGDTGGRALFARYRPEWLPWHDESILLDVDTEADYARLMETLEP